ncbi:MAG: Zn-ribbon domain-containing OB-fold protein [Hyphomicrobiaceae bacterium]
MTGLTGEHLGMGLTVDDLDIENVAFFSWCAKGDFRLQKCRENGLLRYPPTTRCPFSGSPNADWVSVEGKGTVHSYNEVHHAIQPAFKGKTPYMLLLVELDTQKGKPSEHDGLRVAGNLVTPDGELAPPDLVKAIGIGSRMRMVFKQVGENFALPMWTLDEGAEQPDKPWRYPGE